MPDASLSITCRCCGKPVTNFDGHPIHTRCIPKHWNDHAYGRKTSRCREYTPKACNNYPCGYRAENRVSVRHEGGEVEHLSLCSQHAVSTYRSARRQSTVESVELEGPAAAIIINGWRAY